jgi:hypothetical protein
VTVETEPRTGGRLVAWFVGAGLVVAVGSVMVLGFRAPGLLLAALLGACAAARLCLPVRMVGVLAVRSRAVDVGMMTAMAVAVAVLALTAPAT